VSHIFKASNSVGSIFKLKSSNDQGLRYQGPRGGIGYERDVVDLGLWCHRHLSISLSFMRPVKV
jgi:hypothetical protein